MVKNHNYETTRATSRIKHAAIDGRVKNLHHTFDNITWSEELTGFLLQGVAYNSLICCTLNIDSSIKERILCYFRCDVSNAIIGQGYFFVTSKHFTEDCVGLQLLEDCFDALGNSCLAFWCVAFCHTHPELAMISFIAFGTEVATLLIINLTENQVKQFPESIFLTTFIPINVIMAAFESTNQRIIGWFSWLGAVAHTLHVLYGLIYSREVSNIDNFLVAHNVFNTLAEMQFVTICPQTKITRRSFQCIVQCSFYAFL